MTGKEPRIILEPLTYTLDWVTDTTAQICKDGEWLNVEEIPDIMNNQERELKPFENLARDYNLTLEQLYDVCTEAIDKLSKLYLLNTTTNEPDKTSYQQGNFELLEYENVPYEHEFYHENEYLSHKEVIDLLDEQEKDVERFKEIGQELYSWDSKRCLYILQVLQGFAKEYSQDSIEFELLYQLGKELPVNPNQLWPKEAYNKEYWDGE